MFALALALRSWRHRDHYEADVDKPRGCSIAHSRPPKCLASRGHRCTLLFAGWVPWTRQRSRSGEDFSEPSTWSIRMTTGLACEPDGPVDQPVRDERPEGALELIDQASKIAEEAGDRSASAHRDPKARVFGDLGPGEESLPWFDARRDLCRPRRPLGAGRRAGRAGIVKRDLGRLDEAGRTCDTRSGSRRAR